MTIAAHEVDLAARAFWELPWAEREDGFARLRREDPISWHRPAESDLLPPEENTRGFHSLVTARHIREVSRKPGVFSSAGGVTMEDFPAEMREATGSFINMDAPRHTELRGVTLAAFTPRNLLKIDEWIAAHVRELVDEIAPRGAGDLVDLYAKQLPGRLFASFFGVHDGELRERIVHLADAMLAWTDPEYVVGTTPLEMFGACAVELLEIAHQLAAERARQPGDDLMTWLVQAEFEGRRMDEAEIGAFFSLLAMAANDTTRHATAHALHAFTEHPDQRAMLLSDPDRYLPLAVEEVIRWATPVIHMRRTAAQDYVLDGTKIDAGDKVVLWYCSANRDELEFAEPFRFDISRDPNRHLGFGGGGPHYCLGAALARASLRHTLREIYSRMPDLQTGEPDFLVANFIHGVKRLPAEWTPPR
jgi:cytochrome P450